MRKWVSGYAIGRPFPVRPEVVTPRLALLGLCVLALVWASPSSASERPRNGGIALTSFLYTANIYVENADGSGLQRVTGDAAPDRWPSLSPTGTHVAFAHMLADGNWAIVVTRLDGSIVTTLPPHGFAADPHWSPDGSKIVYAAGDCSGCADRHVVVYDLSILGEHSVTPAGSGDYGPSWSPDGTRILFARGGNDVSAVCTVNPDGTGFIQLTHPPAWDIEPRWSPDGKQIVYAGSAPGGGVDLFVMNADGSAAHDITNVAGEVEDQPDWARSGIVFRSKSSRGGMLAVVQPDGTGYRLLAQPPAGAGDSDPSWSRDGSHVVFSSDRDLRSEIDFLGRDGRVRALAKGPLLDFGPSWSPDGRRLALARLTQLGASNIVVRTPSGRLTNLTQGRGSNFDPAWSPDGKRIAFSSFQSGAAEIWVMDAKGRTFRQLTHDGAYDAHASWSPDGKRIVYVIERGNASQLSIVDVASGRERPLLGGTTDLGPSWSPDGRFIAFYGKRGEARHDIWIVRPDGSGLRRLTSATTDVQNIGPAWSPDGSLVLYVAQVVGFGGDTSLASVSTNGAPGPALARHGWVIRAPAWQALH